MRPVFGAQYTGYDSVRRYVSRRLGSSGRPGPRTRDCKPAAPAPPSPRTLSFAFIRRAEQRETAEQTRLDKRRDADAGLGEALDLAAELNPDGYLNNDLKGQVNATGLPGAIGEVRSHIQKFMRQLLHLPEHVMNCFQHPSVQYAAALNQ